MKWNLTIGAVAQEFIISLNWRIPVVKEIHWRIPVNTHEERRTLEEFQFLYLTPEKISFKIFITRLPPKNSTQKFAKKAKKFSPYSSRIASWNSQICAGTVAQAFILKWALGYNNPLFIFEDKYRFVYFYFNLFITNFTVVRELTHWVTALSPWWVKSLALDTVK
jgi:hypothetical protein